MGGEVPHRHPSDLSSAGGGLSALPEVAQSSESAQPPQAGLLHPASDSPNSPHPDSEATHPSPQFETSRRRWVSVRAPLGAVPQLVESEQVAAMLPGAPGSVTGLSLFRRERSRVLSSCLISAVCHGLVLVVLSLWMIHVPRHLGVVTLFGRLETPGQAEELETDLILEQPPEELDLQERLLSGQPAEVEIITAEDPGQNQGESFRPEAGPSDPAQPWGADEPQWLRRLVDHPTGGGLEGRRPEMRARLALAEGSAQTEEAVERGLRWIAVHQEADGSWRFDLKVKSCRGYCRNPGTEPSTAAATALALLPFLGAGYTHREGPYIDTVQRGFYYLIRRGRQTDKGLDFQEGMKNGMYAQGLAAIALCEAYAMTKDPALREPAQEAIRFIESAQDKAGGGWRYRPGEPGDTTVTGWQLMALKSAEMAGLKVDRSVQYAAQRFLDSVASDGGARYGYQDRSPRPGTTAIGLLCRMYSGWPRQHPPLAKGIAQLVQWGPSQTDIYYNYYAQQVMRHWGGSDWKWWNDRMKEFLLSTQAHEGHEAGSWYFDDAHARVGGRLYTTAMAVMILEVYYRHMPLYGEAVFPGL